MRNLVGFGLFMAMSFFGIIHLSAEITRKESDWVGGPCDYRAYTGQAKIVSVIPQKGPTPSRDEYEVKFLFFSEQEVEESYAQVEGKEFLLLIDNAYSPKKAFIEKHNLKVGTTFDCTLRVITKGTCPPMLFEFPSIFKAEGRKE